ncbi:MAG: PLP-dependent aspartate aminotransferase family protein [Elusimicrobiota bacterium]|jgi:cystathionine beta-lyase|nr:PLP-dependent aspartate aminotransferase family protein [Elusimicrobiota bacterium]
MRKNVKKDNLRSDTLCIHGGNSECENTGAVNIPIYQAVTFRQSEMGKFKFEYGRTGNPTRQALERLSADLEGAAAGFAFASGLSAITTILLMFKSGDKILLSQDIYGGTFRIFNDVFINFNLKYEIVDICNLDFVREKFAKDKNIKAVIAESPTNPLLNIIDIAELAKIAKSYGALTIIDNTFMSPYLQRPLDLGADISVHSATKYLGGHSDVLGGLVMVKDKSLSEKIAFLQNSTGAVLQPFDCFLLMRGIKTLSVRMDRHLQNAQFLAEFLDSIDAVEEVFYCGLKNNKGYELNKKQAKGAGAIISFKISPQYDINKFFKSLNIIAFAESLGGVESLICHPSTMTHAGIPKNIRELIGITDNLIRLSVGIENKEDLKNDILQALEKSKEK